MSPWGKVDFSVREIADGVDLHIGPNLARLWTGRLREIEKNAGPTAEPKADYSMPSVRQARIGCAVFASRLLSGGAGATVSGNICYRR
ncbi:hypothetical protein [Altericista sp. CCNU0014]|uniref:hypothetical protein n=1 Tax=Altericista sp. CCNU0014 TaxID=3082949 RepID=UPI00384B2BD2